MSKQVYDEEEDDGQMQEGPNWTLLIVAYFALLAIAVAFLRPYHLRMGGMFFAMAGAGVVLALLFFLVQWIIKRFSAMNMTVKDAYDLAIGYSGYEREDEGEEERQKEELPCFIERNRPLHLSDTFQPSVRRFLCVMALIIGLRRSGKSNLLLVLAEELAKYAMPLILFDAVGEYEGLVSLRFLRSPKLAASLAGYRDAPREEARQHFILISKETAYDFGQMVMNGHLQVVVNLKSWSDEEAAVIMYKTVQGVADWEASLANEDRLPMMFLVDEAQKWFPQNPTDKAPGITTETQNQLEHAFYQIVVEQGSKFGLGLIVATLRYSRINKNLLQSQWKFLLYQSEEIDLARYKKAGVEPEEARALQKGECYVFSETTPRFKMQTRLAHADHQGKTPDLDALERYTRKLNGTTRQMAPSSQDGYQTRPTRLYEQTGSLDQYFTPDMRLLRPLQERAQGTESARNATQNKTHPQAHNEDGARNGYAQNNALRPPLEATQGAQNDAMKYRLSDEQVAMFRVLYPNVIPNKYECLRRIGANSAYRAHANEIIDQMRKGK